MSWQPNDPQDLERVIGAVVISTVRAELVSITTLFANETAKVFTDIAQKHLNAGDPVPSYTQALAHMTGVFETVSKRLESSLVRRLTDDDSEGDPSVEAIFEQASDTGHHCNHEVLIRESSSATRCERCGKRWCLPRTPAP